MSSPGGVRSFIERHEIVLLLARKQRRAFA
jgi:hypothetical protein